MTYPTKGSLKKLSKESAVSIGLGQILRDVQDIYCTKMGVLYALDNYGLVKEIKTYPDIELQEPDAEIKKNIQFVLGTVREGIRKAPRIHAAFQDYLEAISLHSLGLRQDTNDDLYELALSIEPHELNCGYDSGSLPTREYINLLRGRKTLQGWHLNFLEVRRDKKAPLGLKYRNHYINANFPTLFVGVDFKPQYKCGREVFYPYPDASKSVIVMITTGEVLRYVNNKFVWSEETDYIGYLEECLYKKIAESRKGM